MLIGPAFRDVKLDKLYPSVGMKKPHEALKVNFGQTPFVFDIESMFSVSQICFLCTLF